MRGSYKQGQVAFSAERLEQQSLGKPTEQKEKQCATPALLFHVLEQHLSGLAQSGPLDCGTLSHLMWEEVLAYTCQLSVSGGRWHQPPSWHDQASEVQAFRVNRGDCLKSSVRILPQSFSGNQPLSREANL